MIRIFRGGNILERTYTTKPDDVFISSEFVKSELLLKKNTLITPAVTSLELIGKVARIDKDFDNTVVGGFVLMLTPYLDNEILSNYLLFAFLEPSFRDKCRKITKKSGAALYSISRPLLMNLTIPIPPIEEQHRIVETLDRLLPLCEAL